jgi:hypothetical protein
MTGDHRLSYSVKVERIERGGPLKVAIVAIMVAALCFAAGLLATRLIAGSDSGAVEVSSE